MLKDWPTVAISGKQTVKHKAVVSSRVINCSTNSSFGHPNIKPIVLQIISV